MTPVLVSVDKAGDLKIGRRKCRLYKKDEVVKVAKKYGISTEKKTVGELCGAIKNRAKNANTNNIPLAKLYPEAARKRAAAKKRVEKRALDRKVAANFMKNMTTRITTPIRERVVTPARRVVVAVMPMPKPSKKAQPLTKQEATKRIKAMKGLTANNKFRLVNRLRLNQHSPRRVVRLARELARLR
jgi:altronate dehydratase